MTEVAAIRAECRTERGLRASSQSLLTKRRLAAKLVGMPAPAKSTPEEITAALAQLPGWDVVQRTPAGSDHAHTELHRLFEFSSFPDAMHFMLNASRFIQVTDHHPSWQNAYSKVEVWITTGEVHHQLSAKDLTLAQYLQELFQLYQS